MAKRKRLSFFRKLLSSWVSLLILSLIAVAFFIIGEFLHNTLLQALAGVLGGAALSLAVTIITSKEAVQQQNAKEANITRKYTYYIPVFTELKQIHDRLEDGKQKKLPYPQGIKGMGNEPSPGAIWGNPLPLPTFTNWAAFKEDPYRSNFTEKACKLFDEVQKSGADYNTVVSEAKDPVIKILSPIIDKAFREWANREDYKRWKAETNGGSSWSSDHYHQWHSYIYRYFQRPSDSPPEAQSLVWAFNLLGWMVVNDIDKASGYMQRTYQTNFQTPVTPDTSWFKSILESVWTELQELACVNEVRRVAGELLVRTVQAKDYVQTRLNYIRDMYEGGEPPL
ncbi:MAG: hypothetical protein ACJ788_10005 [Ktedonobacteraceae bacterium]